MGTQISQRVPSQMEAIAAAVMAMVQMIVDGAGRDQDYIINMDQSPIPFTFDRQRTLELVGAHTVSIHKSSCDNKLCYVYFHMKLRMSW